jgi:hypothetical protein
MRLQLIEATLVPAFGAGHVGRELVSSPRRWRALPGSIRRRVC